MTPSPNIPISMRILNKIRIVPRWFIFSLDILFSSLALFLPFAIRNNLVLQFIDWVVVLNSLTLAVLVNALVFVSLKTYRGIVRYTGMQDALRIFMSIMISAAVLYFAQFFNAGQPAAPMSNTVLILYSSFSFLFCLDTVLRLNKPLWP